MLCGLEMVVAVSWTLGYEHASGLRKLLFRGSIDAVSYPWRLLFGGPDST